MLDEVGFQSLVYEDFLEVLETLMSRVANAVNGEPKLTHQGLVEAFNDVSRLYLCTLD